MEISIIIPYKNYMGYLRECLESVQRQTFTDYEVIIAYHEQEEQNIKLIESEFKFKHLSTINCGDCNVSIARNQGLKVALGNYICFLDADDYLLPNTLETWMNTITESTMKIDVLFGAIINNSLKYESFLTDFYKYQTNFQTNKNLDVVIKDKSQLKGKKFDSKTIIGKLFKRKFLMKTELCFDEGLSAYGDLPFLLNLLEFKPRVNGTKETIYIKRLHSDSISMPSLTQSLGNQKSKAICDAYLVASEDLNKQSAIKRSLDQFMIEYIWNSVVSQLAKEDAVESSYEVLETLRNVTLKINLDTFKDLPLKQRNLIKKLNSGKYDAVIRYSKFVMQGVELKAGLKGRFEFKKYMYNNWLIRLKPKSKTVVFESFLGRQYSCNPKAIYEYMCKEYPDYHLVWSIDPKHKENFVGLDVIERFSWKWLYTMARARYWVINSRLPLWMNKPSRTTYLQTWHGTPLKKLVFDVEEVYMPGTTTEKYKQNFYLESRKWDYLISPNEYSSEIFKRAFRFDKSMLEIGYPRNDVLYKGNYAENIDLLKRELKIPLDKKVILYAPTFRDNKFYMSGNYKFDLPMDLANLKKKYGKECVILLRMHYLVAENFDLGPYRGFAYDFSNRADINDLYLVADLLITDYSSVFFDYANLGRPIAFYTYDLKDYREKLRGFYFDLVKEAPGPLVETEQGLFEVLDEFLEKGQFESHQTAYETFYQKYCYLDEGESAKQAVEQVFVKS